MRSITSNANFHLYPFWTPRNCSLLGNKIKYLFINIDESRKKYGKTERDATFIIWRHLANIRHATPSELENVLLRLSTPLIIG